MNVVRCLGLIGVVTVALAAPVRAEGEKNLRQVSLGEYWGGPRWSVEDLEGRVVVLEFWGYHCPPCRASVPHLQKLWEQQQAKGLAMIGTHVQNEPRGKVLELAGRLGADYAITSFGRVPWSNVSGIPRIFVFDHRGEQVFEGRPDASFDKAVEEALRQAPDFLTGDRAYRALKKEAEDVRARRNLGKALAAAEKRRTDANAKTAEEATFLAGRVERYGRRLLAEAERVKYEAPERALEGLREVEKLFKGHALAAEAEAARKALEKDERFAAERKAYKLAANADALCAELRPCKSGAHEADVPALADCGDCQAKNAALRAQLHALRKKLEGDFADTEQTRRLVARLRDLGVPGS